jgi:DNA-directed RNA polymerase specialized sigma24 family protein
VARLPSELGALYQLRASGMSYEELAQVLAVPLGTVKSRMHTMIARLREELGR